MSDKVDIEIELFDFQIEWLDLLAKENNVTRDELIEQILRNYMKECKDEM